MCCVRVVLFLLTIIVSYKFSKVFYFFFAFSDAKLYFDRNVLEEIAINQEKEYSKFHSKLEKLFIKKR